MFISNFHSHCTFCDGRSSMEDFVIFAIAKGLRHYGFSSHAPLPFHTSWNMPKDDFPDYVKEFYRLKEKYKNDIELYIGLEVDYIHDFSSIKDEFFKTINLDYSISSIHFLEKLSAKEDDYWSIDGRFQDFDNGLKLLFDGDIKQAAIRYLDVSKAMIESGGFDVVGHVDKITYHGLKYADFKLTDNWFVSRMADIFELIKRKNLKLEINTKSLNEYGITYPHQNFYSLINEIGIPIMVNSDCHYPTNVTDGFVATYQALKKTGFKAVQCLKNGSWETIDISEACSWPDN